MASPQSGLKVDRYVVMHVATTCDEHGVYVTKDSAEVIELGWIILDAKSTDEVVRDSVLVKPINTPITPLCTSLTTLTWEHVRGAGTFRDAITRLDTFINENLIAKNLEFVFVTLDAWDLRVQLPREARDKAVVLPPYLQHSRTFDLRTEYQRWQQHHPESLPFGPSMLSNICAALEVEPVQSSAPIKHNLPFHLQALAPASPRRAMEEAITLARVLRGLIRKSQPVHEHPDVLTRPMDARADVRAFLAERSKVLHMSGLPHDTTQSELESWFTQYGGRPIAFWTLRTPEQHKPTGSGFAIFSSHEEAAESLCMNGRALNEKAIEVSPSSSRVIDRGNDILTPFPPSKNRPRPGDWTCPSCGFSNFQRRTACFRCSFPAGGNGHMGEMGFGNYSGFGGPGNMMHGGHGHMGGHHGHGHMGGHHGGGGRMGGSGVVPFRAGDWKCGNEICGYHNFAENVCCLRCGAGRANAAIVADSGYSNNNNHNSNNNMDGGNYNMHHGAGGMNGANAGPPGGFNHSGNGFPPNGASGNYGGPHFGGPPSTYSLPSGLPPGPPPSNGYNGGGMNGHFGAAPGSHPAGFDSRAAEAAFQSAGSGPTTGAGSNSFYATNNENDPFPFLASGMSNLSVGGGSDPRANNGPASAKPKTSA